MKKENPIPQGNYVPATRCGNLIFTAGMTPRKNGVPTMTGRVEAGRLLEDYRQAVEQAADNALAAAENQLKERECIGRVLSLQIYVNAQDDFTDHSKLADFASAYLCQQLGGAGIAARAALGVATLPGNAPFELQMICAVEEERQK